MAQSAAALWAIVSFLWLSHNVEKHPLVDRPRLSASLILLVAGGASFLLALLSRWLPGANGRFDDEPDLVSATAVSSDLPKRPRRYSFPVLVAVIVLRLELLYRVTYDIQCSKPGIESFSPLALLIHEVLFLRKPEQEASESDDGFPKTIFEELGDWLSLFTQSGPVLIVSTLLFTYGSYLIANQGLESTFFCAALDRRSLVVALQWLGLLLDAIIAILLWRMLAWTRSTRGRLKLLGGISISSALALASASLLVSPFAASPVGAVDSLYAFDVFADGCIFSVFLVSSGLVVSRDRPATLSAILVFTSGLFATTRQILLIGSWKNVWKKDTYAALSLLCVGFIVFMYMRGLRSVALLHRAFVTSLLVLLIVITTIFFMLEHSTIADHPLERLIYDRRIEADRWQVYAKLSESLPVAVGEYQERNHGRDPPPKFDVWFQFATEHKSPIIDAFTQIGNDLLPFWAFPPDKIRRSLGVVARQPGIALMSIQGGSVSHQLPQDAPHRPILDDLVDMIEAFAEHLPDMELAINLNDQPRVLAKWPDKTAYTEAGKRRGLSKLLPKRSDGPPPADAVQPKQKPGVRARGSSDTEHMSAGHFRRATASSCPPGSSMRSGVHWDVRDFCFSCIGQQSDGLFLEEWDVAQDICHQTDIARLHSFYALPHSPGPLEQLLPVFSRAKTSTYSDILIPMGQLGGAMADEAGSDFGKKSDALFWRGGITAQKLSHDALRGGHRARLVHLINNSSLADRMPMLLPAAGKKDTFVYESASVLELNKALPFDVGVSDYGDCSGTEQACEAVRRELGYKPESATFQNRYVLLTDEDDGPPAGLLPALHSTSVPLVASVFREWYSERLLPWVHFVPIDIRYHGLHSTLAYFVGIKKGEINGRDPEMRDRRADAKWIAEQGKRWAEKALRREDMEVYLFRLLLEWGRLINDDRDKIGFRLEKTGYATTTTRPVTLIR